MSGTRCSTLTRSRLEELFMDPWRTAIVDSRDGHIRMRGYDVASLMTDRTFTDTIFLLHQGRLPSPSERALLDAILTAVADHGSGAPSCAAARLAASGNRQSLSAAVAAGILAVGDDHGGAGSGCMEMIAAGLALAQGDGIDLEEAARRVVTDARAAGKRLPGFGHRVHTTDPRTAILFDMARAGGNTGNGVAFVEALERAIAELVKPLPINVDGALAAVLHDLGFSPPFGRLVFIIGRVAGLTAEVAEELAREKPMRIKIPVEYDGEGPRALE
jgi:citrate synthase